MAFWVDPSSRCALCAWVEPKENLRDIKSFTETEPSTSTCPDAEGVQAHDFCWKRLMKHLGHPPNLDKLIRVLQETALPHYSSHYKQGKNFSFSGIKEMGSKDIKAYLRSRTTRRNHSVPRRIHIQYETISQTDIFQRLPLEIRFMVAVYLSTPDFLRLRVSSKAMALLFEDEHFWRTRFLVHGERGYFHFLTEPQESYQTWRLLYRCSRPSNVWPPKFNKWRKQWLINETIRDRYIMTGFETGSSDSTGSKLSNISRWTATGESIHWKRYRTHCQMHLRRFPYCDALLPAASFRGLGVQYTACRSCCQGAYAPINRKVIVFHPILKIEFSVLVENERVFITGFDLVHGPDIPDTSFGYRIPGKKILSDLQGQPLRGFQIKTQWPAILDISPITENTGGEDVEHDWVGDHESLAVYRKRAVYDPSSIRVSPEKRNIVVISGHFLGRLLVGLAIGSVSDSSACGIL